MNATIISPPDVSVGPARNINLVWLKTELGSAGQVIGRVCDNSDNHDKIVFFDRNMTVQVPLGVYVLAAYTLQREKFSIAVCLPYQTSKAVSQVYPWFIEDSLDKAKEAHARCLSQFIKEDNHAKKIVPTSPASPVPSGTWLSNLAKSLFGE